MSISGNLSLIRNQIAAYEYKYARVKGSVQLVAASKSHPAEKIAEAASLGQTAFGENYVQEAREKHSRLGDAGICWHFIGPVQSNKTASIAEIFDWVHGIDRVKIARRLSQQRPSSLAPLKVLIQVNPGHGPDRAGVSPAEVPDMSTEIASLSGITLKGLMVMSAPGMTFTQQRDVFRQLAGLRDNLVDQGLSECQHLSMGMSQDYEAAIAEGATLVRIGTGIFGPRPYSA